MGKEMGEVLGMWDGMYMRLGGQVDRGGDGGTRTIPSYQFLEAKDALDIPFLIHHLQLNTVPVPRSESDTES